MNLGESARKRSTLKHNESESDSVYSSARHLKVNPIRANREYKRICMLVNIEHITKGLTGERIQGHAGYSVVQN